MLGLRPKTGALDLENTGPLKFEERLALEALARREGKPANNTPSFFLTKAYGTVAILSNECELYVTPASPLAAQSAAQIEDGTLVYSNAYPSTDVLYLARPGFIEKMYFVRRPLDKGALAYRLEGNTNVDSMRLENGRVVIVSKLTHTVVFELTPPVVTDRHGCSTPGIYSLSPFGEAWILTLSFDPSGLEYPLLIN